MSKLIKLIIQIREKDVRKKIEFEIIIAKGG